MQTTPAKAHGTTARRTQRKCWPSTPQTSLARKKAAHRSMTTSKANSGYQLIGECAGECNANERTFIMYDASKWKVIDSGDFALSDKPSQLGSNTWGLAYNRAATWGRFQHKTSGDNVCFVNTHYDMSLGQQKSSELIAKQMASICKEGDLAMLTGDLNTVPNSGPVKYLVGSSSPFQLTNTLELAGVSGGTFIGNGVFTGKLSSTVFDYVLAKSSQLCVQEGEVIDERFDGTAISDHALVMSTFCLGSGCSDCKKGQKLSSSGDIGSEYTPAKISEAPSASPNTTTEMPMPTPTPAASAENTPNPPASAPPATDGKKRKCRMHGKRHLV